METPLTSFKPQPIGAKVRQLVEECTARAAQELRAVRQRGYAGHLGTLMPEPEQAQEPRHD